MSDKPPLGLGEHLEPEVVGGNRVPEGQPGLAIEEDSAEVRLFDPESAPADVAAPTLRDKYMVPPFTILDRRQGSWQERAKQWKKLGMESELGMQSEKGREHGEGTFKGMRSIIGNEKFGGFDTLSDNMSIFDPFLCEIAYHWFAPEGGVVLDPFAGGSVRGIIAGSTGRPYIGFDLSEPQVQANREQADRIMGGRGDVAMPTWVHGDSRAVLATEGCECDLVFTCPPYGDLEVYSDNPADLSTMDPADFARAYAEIIDAAVRQLKADRFAAVVVGNYRDKEGTLRDLVGLTVQAMARAGARYYNEAIIIDPIGTAAVRAPRQFAAQRKLVRVHQQLLVFVKGDPKVATDLLRRDIENEQGRIR